MSDNGSGSMTAVVAIVAIIAILGVGYFLMRNGMNDMEPTPVIDIEVPAGDAE